MKSFAFCMLVLLVAPIFAATVEVASPATVVDPRDYNPTQYIERVGNPVAAEIAAFVAGDVLVIRFTTTNTTMEVAATDLKSCASATSLACDIMSASPHKCQVNLVTERCVGACSNGIRIRVRP